MARAFLIVMDSFGIGGAPDAAAFGDEGSNTAMHIARACAAGQAEDGRSGPLTLPNLDRLGLGAAIAHVAGETAPGFGATPNGLWGAATEISQGKDTPSGHWELTGVPVPLDWHYFPNTRPAFPSELTDLTAKLCETAGILGNEHASGTEIIDRLGAEHMRTGFPIVYTSADSVYQIAAHEEVFGLERLLNLCRDLAPKLHWMGVGRVIARPFVGDALTGFMRTTNRKDLAIEPPSPTLIDWCAGAKRPVHAIGKIWDIFSGRGLTDVVKGDDVALMDALYSAACGAVDGSLTFANFVEFDALYGHRRDVSGYARALEWFDTCLPKFLDLLGQGDLAIFTADHGNDPTWEGTDHTRERVPVLVYGAGAGVIGDCGFADVAASIAQHLDVPSQGPGRTFLP